MRFEDDAIDLASAGVDLAVRIVPVTVHDVIQTRLQTYEHVVVAAPRWIARNSTPAHPGDLEALPCIAMKTDRAWTRWRFRRDDDTVEVRVQPIVEVNEPRYLADEPIRRRRLVRLLHDWTLPSGTAYVLHARRRRLSAVARECLALFQRVV